MICAPLLRYARPGCTVKYSGTSSNHGSGNGGRSIGIAVMFSLRTIWPLGPRMMVPAGRRTSRPGIDGVVRRVSLVVGEVTVRSPFGLSGVIQIGASSRFSVFASSCTPISKEPKRLPAIMPPSIASTWCPAGSSVSRNWPRASVMAVALVFSTARCSPWSGRPLSLSACPARVVPMPSGASGSAR